MRPIGSENRVINPYRMLSLRVIEQACDDKDKWYLRRMTDDLKFWLDCAGIDHKVFQKGMRKRFPDLTRKINPLKIRYGTKPERNREIVEYRKANPELSYRKIALVFGLSWERIRFILKRWGN